MHFSERLKGVAECKHMFVLKMQYKKISAISRLPVCNGQISGRYLEGLWFSTIPFLTVRRVHLKGCEGLLCHLLVILRLHSQETATRRNGKSRSLAEAATES